MARKIIGREKRYVEVDVRFEPDGHCGRWRYALDRSRCTRSTRSRTSAAAPPRWAAWGTGMSV